MDKSSIVCCLFQKCSLLLSPTIPFKHFFSLQSMCMKFSNLTFPFEKHTFAPEKCLKSRFCDLRPESMKLTCQFRRFLARTFRPVDLKLWQFRVRFDQKLFFPHRLKHQVGNLVRFHTVVVEAAMESFRNLVHVAQLMLLLSLRLRLVVARCLYRRRGDDRRTQKMRYDRGLRGL